MEGARRNIEQVLGPREQLALHGQITIFPVARRCCNALGHFLLNQECGSCQQSGVADVIGNDRRGNVIGEVPHQNPCAPGAPVGMESVSLHHFEAGFARPALANMLSQDGIQFDRHNPLKLRKKILRECAFAGANLYCQTSITFTSSLGDALQNLAIGEKMLTEFLPSQPLTLHADMPDREQALA
jgi:hypothetical protein